jgi:hypothetical protein
MADGQLAINTASGSPGLFFKDAAGNVVKIGPVHVGSGAPNVSPASGGTSGNSIGEQWLDNSGGTYVFKVWDGSAWRSESGEFVNVTGDTMTGSLTMGPAATLIFEGSVDDGFETVLTVVNPTADQTITLPDTTGTVVTTGDTGTVTSTMLLDGTILNADVNASAAIAGTKIAPDFGSQTVQTTGIFSHALGSAAAPTITFTGDTNTGIYSPGADQLAISTNGTQRINIEADGDINIDSGGVFYDATNNRLGIGTTNPNHLLTVSGGRISLDNAQAYSAKDSGGVDRSLLQMNSGNSTLIGTAASLSRFLLEGTGTGEAARIDSSGRLLVGTSSTPPAVETIVPQFVSSSATGSTAAQDVAIYNYQNASGSGRQRVGPKLLLGNSRSGTNGSLGGIVVSGDQVGNIRFAGDDGSAFITAAEIFAEVDGTPGVNDMPGRIVLSTTADGASSPTERFRITNDGVIAHDQPAPAAVNATATLTVANLKAGIITSTSAAATDMTLPTGTDTQAGFSGTYDNFTFEWSVINTGPSLVRVLAGTAHTVVGSGSVATGTSGRFASRRTATNTFVTYRLS